MKRYYVVFCRAIVASALMLMFLNVSYVLLTDADARFIFGWSVGIIGAWVAIVHIVNTAFSNDDKWTRL